MAVPRRLCIALAIAAAAMACAGCGLVSASGSGSAAVNLTVTRGFGAHQIGELTRSGVGRSKTVGALLSTRYRIATGAGHSVRSIDGLGSTGGATHWFYFVDGVQGPRRAASAKVHAGDRIWWDLHDGSATQSVPAVVGSFPAPFAGGIAGKRYPVTVECAPDAGAACRRVTSALAALHVKAAPQLLGTGSGTDTLGLLVGTWNEIRGLVAAALVAHGPGASGVYARFAGNSLQLLDGTGHVARTLGAGAGLIAATADRTSVPTWMITGTDLAGVTAAARALTPQALHDHFALAVQGSRLLPVPLAGS